MKQKVVCFLVFLVALFFLSVGVGVAGANSPPKMTKNTELEVKLVKVEADLKKIKSEFGQVEKGLTEMKDGLEKIQKKMVAKKQILDNKKSSNPLWLSFAIFVVLAIFLVFLFS